MAAAFSAQMSMSLTHSPDCSTIFLRSIYDKSCPRCKIINIVIHLRRTNGFSLVEAANRMSQAAKIGIKYGLKQAELLDRLYVSKTNQIVVAAKPKPKRNRIKMEVGDDEI